MKNKRPGGQQKSPTTKKNVLFSKKLNFVEKQQGGEATENEGGSNRFSIENNFLALHAERAKRDRWMALVPRFMVDQEFPVRCMRLRFPTQKLHLPLIFRFPFVSAFSAMHPSQSASSCVFPFPQLHLSRVRRREMSLGCIHNMAAP